MCSSQDIRELLEGVDFDAPMSSATSQLMQDLLEGVDFDEPMFDVVSSSQSEDATEPWTLDSLADYTPIIPLDRTALQAEIVGSVDEFNNKFCAQPRDDEELEAANKWMASLLQWDAVERDYCNMVLAELHYLYECVKDLDCETDDEAAILRLSLIVTPPWTLESVADYTPIIRRNRKALLAEIVSSVKNFNDMFCSQPSQDWQWEMHNYWNDNLKEWDAAEHEYWDMVVAEQDYQIERVITYYQPRKRNFSMDVWMDEHLVSRPSKSAHFE